MKKLLLASLLVSNVYASDELLQCYDMCLNAFRQETDAYPNMSNGRLMILADATKECCAICDYQENLRVSFISSIKHCHNQCVESYNTRLASAKSLAEQVEIFEESRGCHMQCEFVADLKRRTCK